MRPHVSTLICGAGLVSPLLIDLFNQFDLSVQLSSWQLCLKFFLDLLANPDRMKEKNTSFPNAKRPRLEISTASPSSDSPASSSVSDYGFLLRHLSCSGSAGEATPTRPSLSCKRPLVEKMSSTGDIRLWSLLSGLSAFFSGLLDSAGHHLRQKEAIDSGSEKAVQEAFGSVVGLTVQLLLACSSFQSEMSDAGDSTNKKNAIQNLQFVLIKVCLLSIDSHFALHALALPNRVVDEQVNVESGIFGCCGSSDVSSSVQLNKEGP
ncbi:unnamed protein product [Taenia asiatica]|uniref:Mon2_C domain-containing protein n=1 Tax=Taenia asiatica TaxID=60517 RepID=A0A0R3VZQ2_TAEAS|nr:unnamed protein product [Taenia asiatica]